MYPSINLHATHPPSAWTSPPKKKSRTSREHGFEEAAGNFSLEAMLRLGFLGFRWDGENIWVFPKMVGFSPQIIHLFIGISIIFTIHFGVPLFLETSILKLIFFAR